MKILNLFVHFISVNELNSSTERMIVKIESVSASRSVVSDSLPLYNPWNSLGQNTGVSTLSLLQEIFPTQGSNPGLLHCRRILYQLSHKGWGMAKKKACSSPTPLPQGWGWLGTAAKEGCRFPSECFTLRSSKSGAAVPTVPVSWAEEGQV